MAKKVTEAKCCQNTEKDAKEEKGILQKIWCFFFGCNCH